VDDDAVYGFGRKPEYMTNSSVVEYHLFAADKAVTPEDITRVSRAQRAMNQRRPEKNAASSDWRLRWFFPRDQLSASRVAWLVDQPSVFARALCLAGDQLCIAGPPDVVDERYAYKMPDVPNVRTLLASQEEAFAGRRGGRLWLVDKSDGRVVARHNLEGIPVFDGMTTAAGRLFLSTTAGDVLCLTTADIAALPASDEEPLQTIWEKPEDPEYLLPLPEPKEGDFDAVSGCKVYGAELGYRLEASGRETLGLVLQKLDKPIVGRATFRTEIREVADQKGLLRNGYLVFGDSANEGDLIKCGVRLQPQQASLVQGPFAGEGRRAVSVAVDAPAATGLKAVVTVDLDAQTVTYLANGVPLQAEFERPLKAITHVGYLMDSALIDVAPIEIEPAP
jgi:hypothetical protein